MTRRRLIFNALLLAGLIGLAVALWFTREPAPAPEPAVSTQAADSIRRAELHLADGIVQLVRDETGRWRLDAPVPARANRVHVDALMQLASARSERRYEPGAIDASTTGVDEPDLVVRFNDEAPIRIGNPGPRPGTRYVATAHALLLVDLRALASLPAEWRGWVAPTLLGRDTGLTRLTLPRLTLATSETGGWAVDPANADRGADYAQATIDAWRSSRALSLEPVDAARQRIARVTLRFADAPTRRLDVIAREPELILRNENLGIDYHFAAHLAGPLLDMRHPDSLGAGRARSLQPSAIPLVPDED